MDLYDEILRSQPLTAFKMNAGETAYTDITNRSVALTADNGTLLFGNAIASTGRTKSMYVKNTSRVWFPGNVVYVQGQERKSWSMEAWFAPINPISGTISIMSHPSSYDGLSADLDYIRFKIDFLTGTDIDLKWAYPDAYEAYHLVGTYTPGKATFYVNGEKVLESDVTEDQLSAGFFSSNPNLYVGQSVANIQGMVDGLATYTRALTDAEVYRHYRAGRRIQGTKDVVATFGGISFDGTQRDIYSSKVWTGKDWFDGLYTDVEFESGALTPIEDPATLLSRAGTWTGVYEVASMPSNAYGIQVDWDGTGAYTIQTSINGGANWVTAVNGRQIIGTWNWSVVDKQILVRVVFTGGTVGDASEVSRLRVTGFTSPYVYADNRSRVIQMFNEASPTNLEFNEPIENNYRAGFETFTGGVYKINADTDTGDPKTVRTLEFWYKANAAPSGTYMFDARPGGGTQYLWAGAGMFAYTLGALYVNGVATATGTKVVEQDVWYHIVYVFSADNSTVIDIPSSGNKQMAVVNTYPTALTAANAAAMYRGYIGYPSASLATESNPVTEPATPYKIYGYDWSISPVG